jgi:hypothetical protein
LLSTIEYSEFYPTLLQVKCSICWRWRLRASGLGYFIYTSHLCSCWRISFDLAIWFKLMIWYSFQSYVVLTYCIWNWTCIRYFWPYYKVISATNSVYVICIYLIKYDLSCEVNLLRPFMVLNGLPGLYKRRYTRVNVFNGDSCNTAGVKHALSISNHEHEHHLAFILACNISATSGWNMCNVTL